jgi:leucyl/phenylalanyl-tRNA--protein transferase
VRIWNSGNLNCLRRVIRARAFSMTDWTSRPRPAGATRWAFPPSHDWPDSDIIAVGGDLEPATILSAYRHGIFPMVVETPEPVLAWWSPEARGILPLDGLRVTRSLRQSAKRYEVRVDSDFASVIRACANPARDRAWITDDFIEAYTTLHDLGWAHSVEVFDRGGTLAGGLYGVRINGLFAGESMFHTQRDASKVALMALVALMRESEMRLLDVQWRTEHLASLGAVEVGRARYLSLLADALQAQP